MNVFAPADDVGEPGYNANGHTHNSAGVPTACNSMVVHSSFITKALNIEMC